MKSFSLRPIHCRQTLSFASFLLLIFACLLCSSCARKPPPSSLQLQTRITDGGLKLFELTFPMLAHHINPPQNSGRPGKPRNELNSRRMQVLLDEVIEESGYCREGYVLLGRYAGETVQRLRGECRDRATAEDRQRFPDSIARW